MQHTFQTSRSSRFSDSISRSDVLWQLCREKPFDLFVIGGGIHGACVAKRAAAQGLSVALVDAGDYANATSSRSSKMAHGGLRYLETFDFAQVFEGIKSRDALFRDAAHLVSPERFLIPVPAHNFFFKIKLGIGLRLYDLMAGSREHHHRWLEASQIPAGLFGPKRLSGCFSYTDGLMNDTRLVIENIIAARRLGAVCANYLRVTRIAREGEFSELTLKDEVSGNEMLAAARIVINCAGPWAPQLAGRENSVSARYSRGSHIIFGVPWQHPSLFLPMPGKSRYYFVWPHAAGTMVGTTEREVDSLDQDPMPSVDEIDEIFDRLSRDLPESGLTRETAHYCFAGVRTLPLRGSGGATARLSRKHLWKHHNGVISLVGGKFTTAEWTAAEGLQMAMKLLGRRSSPVAPSLAGAMSEEQKGEIENLLSRVRSLSPVDAQRLIQRYGSRAAQFTSRPWSSAGDFEVAISFEEEQAVSLLDVMRRRLDLEFAVDHGLAQLPSIMNYLQEHFGTEAAAAQLEDYACRIERVQGLIGRNPAVAENMTNLAWQIRQSQQVASSH